MKIYRTDINEQKIIVQTIQLAREKMKDLPPSHGWDHVQRVVSLCEKICEKEKSDAFIVKLAAILHDIARDIEDKSKGRLCHARLGGKMAYEFLLNISLDHDTAYSILHCIESHRFRNNEVPQTIEAKILYDADKLDSIGAIGIGRAFLFSGEINANLHNSTRNVESTSAYSSEDTAYREYRVKLIHIKNKMLTEEGKRLAVKRHEFMEIFFNQLKSEINGGE